MVYIKEKKGFIVERIKCYKCSDSTNLLVEEMVNIETGEVVDTNYICSFCAGISKCS